MKFTIIPFEGTDILKLGLTREENKKILLASPERFSKAFDEVDADDFGFCHIFYDKNDKSEAIEFFEPTEIIFNNLSLIKKRYHEVVVAFEKLDEYLDFEEGVGFVSKKYDIGIFAPYGIVEAVLVGKKDYYDF